MATLLMSSNNSQRGSSIAQLLRSNGYEVIEMADEAHSPMRFYRFSPSLVLVDIRGVDIDRTKLIARLQTAQLNEVPAVVLAGHPLSEDDIAAYPDLATALWLVEPVADITLLTCINTVQHMQRAQAHLRNQNKRLETLMDITDTSWQANGLGEQAEQVLEYTLQALSCTTGGIWLLDQDRVSCLSQRGLNAEQVGTSVLHTHPLSEMIEQVIVTGQPHYIQARSEATCLHTSSVIQPCAIVPLGITPHVIGALMVGAPQAVEFSQDDRTLLQEIAFRVTSVFQHTKHHEQMEREHYQLEMVDRKKDEFLSLVTHEIKNPMASIKGYADLMMRRMSKDPADPNLKGVRIISQQIVRMTTLLDYLLDFSRINLDRIQLCKTQCDLVALAQQVVEGLRETTKHHELRIEATNASIQAVLDETRIYRAVSNVVSNAIKYSQEGGTITVRTGCTMAEHGPEAIISVSDQGIGIPQAEIKHLFERFFRASNVSENDAGLGLGLFLASEIVKRHGGRIWAESQEQQGSTFWIALPLMNDEQQTELITGPTVEQSTF